MSAPLVERSAVDWTARMPARCMISPYGKKRVSKYIFNDDGGADFKRSCTRTALAQSHPFKKISRTHLEIRGAPQ
jgi:hypothetical protein